MHESETTIFSFFFFFNNSPKNLQITCLSSVVYSSETEEEYANNKTVCHGTRSPQKQGKEISVTKCCKAKYFYSAKVNKKASKGMQPVDQKP